MGNCCTEAIDFNAEVELRQFDLLRSVGKGAFGKVRIVQKKDTKQLYALKYINKDKCIKMKAVHNIIQERRLLEEIDYPLIVNLRYAFQDDENMFMVLDLKMGGDVRFHLDRTGPMSQELVRVYVAEIASAIRYLHERKIVHRDLKPDNILLDNEGHVHLTDFNIAVRYKEGTPLRSIAGSMAYMAPEVLRKSGYYSSPDWWSLGVVMYELLFAKRPFRGKTNDALTMAIMNDGLTFPSKAESTVSAEALSLMRALMERDVDVRIGDGTERWELLKNHPFFSVEFNDHPAISWDDVPKKTLKLSFVPNDKKANFDATHELEELLLEDNPLRARKRKANRDYSSCPGGASGEYAREMRMIDRKFTVFDFENRGTTVPAPAGETRKSKSSGVDIKSQTESHVTMQDLGNFERESQDHSPNSPDTLEKSPTMPSISSKPTDAASEKRILSNDDASSFHHVPLPTTTATTATAGTKI